ncbi:MAG TPA: SAM-dependent chlorinase/fluorinase [Acidimicrobiales bacterium]|nr:SAM-dependent chlorinase/fluorinase [Acidimicrobiales bacterium]
MVPAPRGGRRPVPGRAVHRSRLTPVVSFLSDYGRADEFVGVVHSVVLTICPAARLVDLTHEVPPYDVAAGADTLVRAAPYLAPGVVLAVVDPGVGGPRRRVVLDCGRHLLVGPDNGLLAPAADALGGIERAFEAEDTRYWWPGSTARTFDGRDVFGPVAAHLACGVDPEAVGPAVDPASLVRVTGPDPDSDPGLRPGLRPGADGWTVCAVAAVDRFGNVALHARPSDLEADGPVAVRPPGGEEQMVRRVGTFAELEPGELGLIVDSSGRLALVLDRAPAAERLAVRPGDRIEIAPVAAPP